MKRFILVLLVSAVSAFANASVTFDVAPQITDDVIISTDVDAPAMEIVNTMDYDFTITREHVLFSEATITVISSYPIIPIDIDHDYGLILSEDAKGINSTTELGGIAETYQTQYLRTNYNKYQACKEFYNCRNTGSYTASHS